ncbi:MAG: nucleotidyl transferase AbiEii/AbiGii toxin family protein [Syntrophales bacterium]|nr:nucleotidyl transferase AbiEii/AbiGii toxin family protein [Syntrophales bacterium]
MDTFIKIPNNEQQLYFEQAQSRLGLPPVSIEKDFWVCWTLWKLFNLPEWGKQLVFKGGTSLSKGWGLIERFSEDIDIVINRDFLGFGGDKSPEKAPSNKQRKNRLENLKETCRSRIHSELRPAIEQCFMEALPAGIKWSLEIASPEEDPDEQTLLFQYPGILSGSSTYLQPQVKIELGARSDTWPNESPFIRPYLADAFPAIFAIDKFTVQAVAPERTFWEKAMLLHEETFRSIEKPRKARLARHYYDLCVLSKRVSLNERYKIPTCLLVWPNIAPFFLNKTGWITIA